ncbi:MAG: TetR/AcrR family transcriptional regulator [Rhizobiaceae bacterium]|nr:TetR/AcrR family transcriptional regulator [Rhizobiaceae bacterium]
MNKSFGPRDVYIAIASRRFGSDGFHGTSLAALAKDAGVTKQALLHFFGTKERLYAEVLNALASRLCSEVESFSDSDPIKHLTDYLLKFAQSTLESPQDARLVVRALLDSDPSARAWPMKPYLDKMNTLVIAASKQTSFSEEEARGWFFPVLGAVQYFAISSTAISGMYGSDAQRDLWPQLEHHIKTSIMALAEGRI